MLNTKLIPHRCVDLELLRQSVQHRVVPREEITSLVNPLMHSLRYN